MIIDLDSKLTDYNIDEITINKDNAIINNPEQFFHYRRNDNGSFDIIYTKNNIGSKAFYNNKIWVLLNNDKDIMYHVINNKELELDSIIDIYEVKNNKKDDSYLCVVSEVQNENGIIDTLGIVINPNTLEPLFVYSVNNNVTEPVLNSKEAEKAFGCPLSVNYRLRYTIEKIIENQLDEVKSSKERCEILEKVIKKQSR